MIENFELYGFEIPLASKVEPPFFFILNVEKTAHNKGEWGKVFAENAKYPSTLLYTEVHKTYIIGGYVSKQSPFGQGMHLRFKREEIRMATYEEICTAIRQDHPFGSGFIPEPLRNDISWIDVGERIKPDVYHEMVSEKNFISWERTRIGQATMILKFYEKGKL